MNVSTVLIAAAGVVVVGLLVVWKTFMVAPAGPHAEFSEECEQSLNTVVDWAIREMESQGGSVTYTQRTTITEKVRPACSCVRDKLGTVVADDKWALAGKLTAIKYEAELAARTQNPVVRTHTEAEARAGLLRLMSDDKVARYDIAVLSRNINSPLKACFQQHFNEP